MHFAIIPFQSLLYQRAEAVTRGCFVLRNLIQFAGKDLCRSLCNFTGEDLQLYFKRDSSTGVFLWILGNFWERLFLQNTSIACFWKGVLIFRQRAQREREREREAERKRPFYGRRGRRDHSIDVSDNTYECLSGLSWRCLFKIMNYLDRFRQCSSFFTALRSSCSWIFWNFQKKILKKNSAMKSRFINVAKRRI